MNFRIGWTGRLLLALLFLGGCYTAEEANYGSRVKAEARAVYHGCIAAGHDWPIAEHQYNTWWRHHYPKLYWDCRGFITGLANHRDAFDDMSNDLVYQNWKRDTASDQAIMLHPLRKDLYGHIRRLPDGYIGRWCMLHPSQLTHCEFPHKDQADLVTKLSVLRRSHVEAVRKSVQGAK